MAVSECTRLTKDVEANGHSADGQIAPAKQEPQTYGTTDSKEIASRHDGAPVSPVATDGGLGEWFGLPSHMSLPGMVKELALNFVPAAAVNFLYFCNQTITMMFVGQLLGVDLLAHYSVGLSVYNACGVSVCIGLATALDTLASQCYGRCPSGPELGELLQLAVTICLACSVPILVFFFFSEPIMVAVFGKDMGVGVAEFLRMAPLYLVFQVLAVCLQKTLQGQRVAHIPLYAAIISAVMCPVYNYFLTPLGLHGAVASITLCSATLFTSMAVMAAFNKKVILGQASWPIAKGAVTWTRVKEFFAMGLPAMFALASEWWAVEIILTFAAGFGPIAVDAFTIAFNLLLVYFSILQGMGTAIAVMAGNSLGANDHRGARGYARLGMCMTLCVALFDLCTMYVLSERIFSLYTNDHRVIAQLSVIRWTLLAFHFVDAFASAFQGTFRGVGRQDVAARSVLIALWCVGVPVSYVLSHQMGMDLTGVMIGLVAGVAMETPLMSYDWIMNWDWPALAALANRAKEHDLQHPEDAPLHDMQLEEHEHLLGNFEVGGVAVPA